MYFQRNCSQNSNAAVRAGIRETGLTINRALVFLKVHEVNKSKPSKSLGPHSFRYLAPPVNTSSSAPSMSMKLDHIS